LIVSTGSFHGVLKVMFAFVSAKEKIINTCNS